MINCFRYLSIKTFKKLSGYLLSLLLGYSYEVKKSYKKELTCLCVSSIVMIMRKCRTCKRDKPDVDFGAPRRFRLKEYWYCKDCLKRTRLARKCAKYNLSTDEHDAILQRQGGTCGICDRSGGLVIDHDHAQETVRGLLCSACNKVLGFARDNEIILRRAIEYLDRANHRFP